MTVTNLVGFIIHRIKSPDVPVLRIVLSLHMVVKKSPPILGQRHFRVTVTKVVGFEQKGRLLVKCNCKDYTTRGLNNDCTPTSASQTKQIDKTQSMSLLPRGDLPAMGKGKAGNQRQQD